MTDVKSVNHIHQSMMGFIVCLCYFFMTIVDISTSAKDGKLFLEKSFERKLKVSVDKIRVVFCISSHVFRVFATSVFRRIPRTTLGKHINRSSLEAISD